MVSTATRSTTSAAWQAGQRLARPVEWLIVDTLEACMARITDPGRAGLPASLWPACIAGLERLWQSRHALARAVLRPPLRQGPGPVSASLRRLEGNDATRDLDIETARASWRFLEAASAAQRDAARARIGMPLGAEPAPPSWALVSPKVCAAVLRWAIERSIADPAARRRLMPIVADELAERLPGLFRIAPAAETVDSAPTPEPESPAAPAAPLSVEDLQPGQWFSICMSGQWTMARLSWRSDNGRFFMFHSNFGRCSHSLSLRSLERLVSDGLIAAVTLPDAAPLRRAARLSGA